MLSKYSVSQVLSEFDKVNEKIDWEWKVKAHARSQTRAERLRPWRYYLWQYIHDPHVFLG